MDVLKFGVGEGSPPHHSLKFNFVVLKLNFAEIILAIDFLPDSQKLFVCEELVPLSGGFGSKAGFGKGEEF